MNRRKFLGAVLGLAVVKPPKKGQVRKKATIHRDGNGYRTEWHSWDERTGQWTPVEVEYAKDWFRLNFNEAESQVTR